MFGPKKTEVLVAGAGPVGLVTALRLAEEGVAVSVVDPAWRTAARSYALALHPGSLELLEDLGVAGELVARGYRIDTVAFYDGTERRGEVRLAELGTKLPFALVLSQETFEGLLVERLAARKVEIRWNHRLARLELGEAGIRAEIEKLGKESMGYSIATTGWVVDKTFDVTAAHVIGADGHHSRVRRGLGIDFPEVAPSRYYGVFEFAADAPAAHEMRVVLDAAGAHVLWPLGEGRFRASFELEAPEEGGTRGTGRSKSRLAVQVGRQAYPLLDRARLEKLLAERMPWHVGQLGEVHWSVGVRFERRLAAGFGHRRAWLVGDAAHLAEPIGVQSMNVGLREGFDLADRLVKALRPDAGADVLASYDAERRREWRRLLGLEGAVEAGPKAAAWARRTADRLPALLPAGGPELDALLAQLDLNWP